MLQSGTYIAVFELRECRQIQVGKFGCFWFKPGLYLYAARL